LCSVAGFGWKGCKWWLQQLGEQMQRRQLVGVVAMVRVVAGVLERAPLGRIEATELVHCDATHEQRCPRLTVR